MSTTVSPTQPFVPVIVGGDLGTYSLAREFHEAYGVTSVVVLGRPNGLVQDSAFIELRPYPAGADEEGMVRHLVDLGEELARPGGAAGEQGERPLLLLGSLDGHVNRITAARDRLEPRYTVPYPDARTVASIALKENFYALCERLDIPHPRTRTLAPAQLTADPDSVATLVRGLQFPLVLKASDSAAWTQVSFPGKQKVHTVADAGELTTLLGRLQAAGYTSPVIVQEHIPGGDDQLRLCTYWAERHDGVTRVTLAGAGEVALEDHAPTMLGNSVAILPSRDDQLVEPGVRLLQEIGWQGFAMIDAKLDPRDGIVKLFEVNPRLGRNHFHLTAAGFNPVRLYVEQWMGLVGLAPQTPAVDPDLFRPSASPGAAGTRVLDAPDVLYCTVPLPLLRRHVHGETAQRIRGLLRSGRTANPLYTRAERSPRRWAYIVASMANHWRKFRSFPPPPAEPQG